MSEKTIEELTFQMREYKKEALDYGSILESAKKRLAAVQYDITDAETKQASALKNLQIAERDLKYKQDKASENIRSNFKAGAVFVDPTGGINSYLVVEVVYPYPDNAARYQLLGIGVASNSGLFHEKVHTKEECVMELLRYRMVYGGNINPDITKLVTNISSNLRDGINKY